MTSTSGQTGNEYGFLAKFTAHPGKRDDLVALFLHVAESLQSDSGCLHYLINTSVEPDAIWVTEVWTTKAAHDASLEAEDMKPLIGQALPLIASISDQTELRVVGGKGL